jgi:spore coat polysaccharide biosynthesis protein SpsF
MQVLMILQARYNSSRLPGKVLKPILGKPMLAHQIERLQTVQHCNKLIVATSKMSSDDAIEQLCKYLAVDCYRGDLDDVLDRYYQASIPYNPDHIVRVTGDCPLIDSEIVDQVINFHINSQFDYTSNCIPPTLPDGLDVEVFTYSALKEAWLNSKLPSEREHVTPYIRNNPQSFSVQNFFYKQDYSHLRWTVDEAEDFELVTEIYQALYIKKPNFGLNDILTLLDSTPNLTHINQKYKRNEGFIKSQAKDKEQRYD